MGDCKVGGCTKPAKAARGFCHGHYARWYRHGDPSVVLDHVPPPPQGSGEQNRNWVGDRVGYLGAHYRVYRSRGKACEYACASCGGPADTWAYNHADPHVLVSPKGHPYSSDPSFYDPMCKRCHTLMDLARTS